MINGEHSEYNVNKATDQIDLMGHAKVIMKSVRLPMFAVEWRD